MPLEPGATFGRYQLAELLGQGGMGEVYSAYDTLLHRKVALKVLTVRPAGSVDWSAPSTDGPARILREARAAAGITHPNAVAIYDVGEVDGVSFLAMELVSGRTLRTYVGDPSVLLARRIRWITDVARALGAAHQLGLVHRDIKPENVMVRNDGVVKVLDFGIARRAVAKGDHKPPENPTDLAALSAFAVTTGTLTADGVVMGTPRYMAPEQIRGDAIDGRVDQFAWGVLAFELLVGKTPWEGEGVGIFAQILSREVDSLTSRNAEIPARVDTVVRKALSKSPDARFATMEEVAEELEPFAAATTGQQRRFSIPVAVPDMQLAATEQISVTGQTAVVPSGLPAKTQGSEGTTGTVPRRRGVRTVAAVAIAVAVLGAVGMRGRVGQVAREVAADAGAVDVPSQMSSNPDATAAYHAGMQALRDGSQGTALKQLGHATELDPLFGAAQLRLALTRLLDPTVQAITSADLLAAHGSQTSLGTHERILLEAFERIAREPPDFEGGRRVLEDATQKYPTDADFPFQLGLLLDLASLPGEAVKALDVSIARDPAFAFSLRTKGEVLIELGNDEGGTDAFKQCLNVSQAATSCLWDLSWIQTKEGKCQDAVASARRLIPLLPDLPVSYVRLAEGLTGSGEAEDAVRAALAQALDRTPAPERPLKQASQEAALAILRGDFRAAQARYEQCDRLADTRELERFGTIYPRVLLDLELGRTAQVTRVAEQFLRERAGLSSRKAQTSGTPLLVLKTAERAAGSMTHEAFVAVRDRWIAEAGDQESPASRWLEAYARPVETGEDAKAAVARMPDAKPLFNLFGSTPSITEPVGRTLLLAGRLDEGIRYLTMASASCELTDGTAVIYSTQAAFELGGALEERGDVPGACAAYDRVLARWGTASPAPKTATNARKRKRALGCAP